MLGSPRVRWDSGLLAMVVFALSGCPVDGRVLLEDYGAGGSGSRADGQLGSGGAIGARDAGASGTGGLGRDAATGETEASFDAHSNGGAGGAGDGGIADGANDGSGSTHGGNTGSGGNVGSGGSAGSGANAGSGGIAGTGGCWDVDAVAARCGANLVRNSRFNQNASDWKPEAALFQHWDPRNGKGGADSGALSIVNANLVDSGSAGLTMVGSSQCLDVAGNATYALGARLFLPGRQGEGYAAVNIWAYADPGCTGTFLGASTPAFVSEVDVWHLATSEIETSPGTRSLLVRLVAVKPFAKASLEVLFDDVAIRSDSGD